MDCDNDDVDGLQWGRNFFVTEIAIKHCQISTINNASMGP